MRRDPSMQDLHHRDIITYALTRLASQYAREKQEILKDLRCYKASDQPVGLKLSGYDSMGSVSELPGASGKQFRPGGAGKE
jgi:hypothetical protein